jgi:4-amino-4-deoxy-L-arabinose transferase-like glycosyltransferase
VHAEPVARWLWFLVWLALGGSFALGMFSLGPLVLVPVALVAIALAVRVPRSRQSAFGLVAGAGVLLLVIAYLNRQGPGMTCWHTAAASGCDEHLNPLPWLVVGVVLVVGGAVAHLRTR